MGETKLLIVGAVTSSAGIGGVSIHVERLLYWLQKNNFPFNFCDYKQDGLFKVVKKIIKHKVVHIHPSNPILRLFFVIVSKILGKKVIFTVHGDLGRFSRSKNIMDMISIRLCDIPIVINHGSYDQAIMWNNNTRLLSAYIPPFSDGYLPDYAINCIKLAKSDDKTIICTNASARSYTNDGKEIYGIDFLVDYFSNHPEYFLCISDPSSQYTALFKDKNISNILFINEHHSFYAIMKMSDIMIRATATDGDSLSVREGLNLGIKVIATDCVSRPNGVILFKYEDVSTLECALNTTAVTRSVDGSHVIRDLITIYNTLL